jgi:hypothetical protein
MTASPYASAAKITEAVAAIGADYVGTRKQTLIQQIFIACALGGVISPSGPFINKIWTDLTYWDDATFWID